MPKQNVRKNPYFRRQRALAALENQILNEENLLLKARARLKELTADPRQNADNMTMLEVRLAVDSYTKLIPFSESRIVRFIKQRENAERNLMNTKRPRYERTAPRAIDR